MAYKLCNVIVLFSLLNLIVEVVESVTPAKSQRTCVVGAGYSGLGTARYLQEYGVNYKVFEATRHVGGTWRFDPHVGTDQDGLPLFTSMYKNLRTNTPRQTMEYAGFKFPDDTPSYPTGTCFHKYLKSFVKHFGLMKNIQLQSLVTSIKWSGGYWNVTYMKSDTKDIITETCDFVVIASGEYREPSWPKIEGMDSFKGKMIHSHDYKESESFRGRRVLLVGAGASGLDLAMHLSNVTSKLVHSHHLNYNQPNFPNTYIKKPDIKVFRPNGATFQDGSFEEIDDVIFCTGYNYYHGFLDTNSGMTTTDKFVLPLYQHTVNIKHPSMLFVGVSKKVINRVMDAQGQYAAAIIAGKFKLPPQEEMLKHWLDHVHSLRAQKMKLIDVNVIGDGMDEYFGNLTKEAGVVRAPPVLTTIRDFNAKNRLEDLSNYRDYDYYVIDDYNYERKYNKRSEVNCPIEDTDS